MGSVSYGGAWELNTRSARCSLPPKRRLSIASPLNHLPLQVPCKLRLVMLAALLRCRVAAAPSACKAVVFFSSCDAVEFYHTGAKVTPHRCCSFYARQPSRRPLLRPHVLSAAARCCCRSSGG